MVLLQETTGRLILVLYVALAVVAAMHALLTKSDPRSALGWIVVCWLFPLAGPVLYALFGVNRVRKRAKQLRTGLTSTRSPPARGPEDAFAANLIRIGDAVTQWARVPGNCIAPLEDGENAFPAMLTAIEGARYSVWLATYIFDTDVVGRQFIRALTAAAARGVQVRVMIDGIGQWYSWPHARRLLHRAGVPTALFLPPRLLPPTMTINLRNHRKLLLIDASTGFLGGMNLSASELGKSAHSRMADLHFQVQGPIVAQLAECFGIDWWFAAKERLVMPQPTAPIGAAICRVITEGPDEDADKLLFVILGALSIARRQLLIMTPYFIPPPELSAALEAAALRGVEVCLILPEYSNLRYVDWASRRWLTPLLRRGVQIFLQPPPFSHTKLIVVDGIYAQIGSANLDPRSLRLNFEIAMEVYDSAVCGRLSAYVAAAQQHSIRFTPASAANASLWVRIRNSLFWLLSPYL